MMSIKSIVAHEGAVWGGDSLFHQKYDFPPHITEPLLSLNPMSGLVKE